MNFNCSLKEKNFNKSHFLERMYVVHISKRNFDRKSVLFIYNYNNWKEYICYAYAIIK